MVSLSSIEKDSIATTRDLFRDCILPCKIRNQTLRKEKFHKQSVVILQKKFLLFCKTCVLYNILLLSTAKVLEKYVRSSSYLAAIFFKENSHSHGKFTERLFLLHLLYTKFFEPIFLKNPVSGW